MVFMHLFRVHPSPLSQCKLLAELWIYFIKHSLSVLFSHWQQAQPRWRLQLNQPLKFTVGIMWTLRIPWHSTNMVVLFWQQLKACWWGHCHFGWHGWDQYSVVEENRTWVFAMVTTRTTGYVWTLALIAICHHYRFESQCSSFKWYPNMTMFYLDVLKIYLRLL